MTVIVWLGSAPPVRTIRWLDGTLAVAATFPRGHRGGVIAIAAGDPTWLDLASDRARRAGLDFAGVDTELQLDYLGWAQIVAAVARLHHATTVVVDEASRADRIAEVAAIAELLELTQLTSVVALAHDGTVVDASRIAGGKAHAIRIRGGAVFGLRIAGPAIEDYPTPMPSASMKRLDLVDLGLDPNVLAHRALPARNPVATRRSTERVADLLALYRRPRDDA
ncbi:MAG: hypothetical protein NT062_22920 [Proteobacteria bacterium]|nr:hypothetical protein [Pseudomonadota bacterium]